METCAASAQRTCRNIPTNITLILFCQNQTNLSFKVRRLFVDSLILSNIYLKKVTKSVTQSQI